MLDWAHKTWRSFLQKVLFLLTDKYQFSFSLILLTLAVLQGIELSKNYQNYLSYVQ